MKLFIALDPEDSCGEFLNLDMASGTQNRIGADLRAKMQFP
jgi:hypothetical protein